VRKRANGQGHLVCHPCGVTTRIKICGTTSLADAEHAADLGAWAVGLIHYERSPRFVEPETAAQIGAALKRRCEVVGVFVNATLDQVAEAAENAQMTILQLHGDEGTEFCEEAARRTGAKVMKAIQVSDTGDVRGAEAFRTDFHLFDAYRPDLRGGTGTTFDWTLLSERRSQIPMVLSGGLTPENVKGAIAAAHPFAVDVVSGVEAEPGIKDPALVEAFFEAVGVPKEPSPSPSQPGTPGGEAEEVAG
jgi:phosphoribosylanthranilate isomerase